MLIQILSANICMVFDRVSEVSETLFETEEEVGTEEEGTSLPEVTLPEITQPVETLPEVTVAETVAEIPQPETTVPETTVPETTIEETSVAEPTQTEPTQAETTVAETSIAETTQAETVAEYTVPQETDPQEEFIFLEDVEEWCLYYLNEERNSQGLASDIVSQGALEVSRIRAQAIAREYREKGYCTHDDPDRALGIHGESTFGEMIEYGYPTVIYSLWGANKLGEDIMARFKDSENHYCTWMTDYHNSYSARYVGISVCRDTTQGIIFITIVFEHRQSDQLV